MCVVSMVGDHYWETFKPRVYPHPETVPVSPSWITIDHISREEFDDLRRQVSEMKQLLARAKQYDEENDEPDCEMEEKMALIKRVAELVGVDISDIV